MKKILIQTKQLFKNLLISAANHEKAILSVCITIMFAAMWSFVQEVEHNAEVLDMEHDIAVLSFQLEHSTFASEEKSAMIIIQSEILNRQKAHLDEADRALESQHRLIQKLFNELKNFGIIPGQKFDPKRSI